MRFETKAIVLGRHNDPSTNTVITPIYQGTTYRFDEILKSTGFEYGRSQNPTRTALENTLAGLEDARFAVAYSSGMAATDAVVAHLVPGDHVVAAVNLYGGTLRLFESYWQPRGVGFSYVKGETIAEFEAAITPKTRFVWVETPTNPQLQVLDIAAIAAVCQRKGVPLVVDNTFASPCFQQPLALGATVVLHSTTKYISGHNDVIGGALMTNDEALAEKFRFYQNTVGAVPSPNDCYLSLRGIKTLALRMKQHGSNAQAIAEYLQKLPFVTEVLYPGLPQHPEHALAKRQMTGFGGMIAFNIRGGREHVNRFAKALKIWHFAESLGGTESLVCHPETMSHAVLSDEQRAAAGITPAMLRLSVGIEHPDDLIEDLGQALKAAEKG